VRGEVGVWLEGNRAVWTPHTALDVPVCLSREGWRCGTWIAEGFLGSKEPVACWPMAGHLMILSSLDWRRVLLDWFWIGWVW
jgi:hypothetical protein